MDYTIIEGDCLNVLPTLESGSVDACITDPIYPCIDRSYGRIEEAEWHVMMHTVVREVRRILKPHGSAMFVLQPNSRKVGSMRAWLFEFQAWCCREWNMVQDVWLWNTAAMPTGVSVPRTRGLLRPSLKACVWLGESDCYRNQETVLWSETDRNKVRRAETRACIVHYPSGQSVGPRMHQTAIERGGVTPYNVLPIPNTDSTNSAGAHGHGAGTPFVLCDWWTRYIVPPDGVVLDPFCGSGTVGLTALKRGHSFIGIERVPEYCKISRKRLDILKESTPLFS